jgi:hypothetical protein
MEDKRMSDINKNLTGNCGICGEPLVGRFVRGNGRGSFDHDKCWYRLHAYKPAHDIPEAFCSDRHEMFVALASVMTEEQGRAALAKFNERMSERHAQRAKG